jgi:hypothetical protein
LFVHLWPFFIALRIIRRVGQRLSWQATIFQRATCESGLEEVAPSLR